MPYCEACGRYVEREFRKGHPMCNKHYKQFLKHGKFLDNNPRTIYDRNEIKIYGDIAYIDIYDKNCNVVATAMVDAEDVDKVKDIKWKLSESGYAINSSRNNDNIHMSKLIMGTKNIVDHRNHVTLDNRKCNLREATKSQNAMNSLYSSSKCADHVKGVCKLKSGRYYAHIKINQKMINLGVYDTQNEALFARLIGEKYLFDEFQAPRKIPDIPDTMAQNIADYVHDKLKYMGYIEDDPQM